MRCITLNPSSWGSVTVAQRSHKPQVDGSTPSPATTFPYSSIGRVQSC